MVLLTKMGFPDRFRDIVMKCVWSASYSVLLIWNPIPSFRLERGLHQGILCHHIYLLCVRMDCLFLLTKAQEGEVLNDFIWGLVLKRRSRNQEKSPG